ncbi:MAG: hypothetical protein ABC550_05880 [Candidatus Methanosuratincola petrocarbonis]
MTHYVKMALGAERVMKEVRSEKETYAETKNWKDTYEGNAVQAFRIMYTKARFLRDTQVVEEIVDPSRGNTLTDAYASQGAEGERPPEWITPFEIRKQNRRLVLEELKRL